MPLTQSLSDPGGSPGPTHSSERCLGAAYPELTLCGWVDRCSKGSRAICLHGDPLGTLRLTDAS